MLFPGKDESDGKEKQIVKMSCVDKLAMALTKKLEQDTSPQQPPSTTHPTCQHAVSDFSESIGNVLALVGIKDLQVLEQYKDLSW